MDAIQATALALGSAWGSGVNVYAAVLTLGLLHSTGHLTLPPQMELLSNPLVLSAAGVMYAIEFFADKIPGVDSAWDAIQTFIRIPAGAVLAYTAVGEVSQPLHFAAAIAGGTLAAGTHATKAGSRAMINTSPEPFSNWLVSFAEDAAVVLGIWAAVIHPYIFLAFLICFVVLMIWLLPRLWRGIRKIILWVRAQVPRLRSDPVSTDT